MSPDDGDLLTALSTQLRRLTGIEITLSEWKLNDLPNHLKMNFKLVDDKGQLLEQSRDLDHLKEYWAEEAASSFQSIPDSEYEQQGLTRWMFGDLPAQITLQQNGLEITAYPALIDQGEYVDLTLLDTVKQAQQQTHLGLRKLFMLSEADIVKYLRKQLPNIQQMCMHYVSVPSNPLYTINSEKTPCEQLKTDLIHLAFDHCFLRSYPAITTQNEFEQRLQGNRSELINTANQLAQQIAKALTEYHAIAKRLSSNIPLTSINAVKDIQSQLSSLIYQGFAHRTPDEALRRLPLYLQAMAQRLDKLLSDPMRDRQWMAEVQPHWHRYLSHANNHTSQELQHYRWMIEEYRMSLFAQGLKTAYPISAKRLEKQWKLCN